MTDISKLAEIKIDSETYQKNYWENVSKKNEHLISFTFPDDWSKADYLEFAREWKATYKIHSELARLLKRARKTVHNVLTPAEEERLDELTKHPGVTAQTAYNGYFGNYDPKKFWPYQPKVRARILLAMRKASKVWAAKQREADLKKAA